MGEEMMAASSFGGNKKTAGSNDGSLLCAIRAFIFMEAAAKKNAEQGQTWTQHDEPPRLHRNTPETQIKTKQKG